MTPPDLECPQDSPPAAPDGDSFGSGAKAGLSSFFIVLSLLAVIAVLLAVIIVQRKKWKKQTMIKAEDTTYSNLAFRSELTLWWIYIYREDMFFLYPDRATIAAPSSSVFDAVSYTAMPQQIPEGRPAPDYDEILDQESSSSETNDSVMRRNKRNVHSDFNHHRGTPQLPGNDADTAVSDFCGLMYSPTKYVMKDKNLIREVCASSHAQLVTNVTN